MQWTMKSAVSVFALAGMLAAPVAWGAETIAIEQLSLVDEVAHAAELSACPEGVATAEECSLCQQNAKLGEDDSSETDSHSHGGHSHGGHSHSHHHHHHTAGVEAGVYPSPEIALR